MRADAKRFKKCSTQQVLPRILSPKEINFCQVWRNLKPFLITFSKKYFFIRDWVFCTSEKNKTTKRPIRPFQQMRFYVFNNYVHCLKKVGSVSNWNNDFKNNKKLFNQRWWLMRWSMSVPNQHKSTGSNPTQATKETRLTKIRPGNGLSST